MTTSQVNSSTRRLVTLGNGRCVLTSCEDDGLHTTARNISASGAQ